MELYLLLSMMVVMSHNIDSLAASGFKMPASCKGTYCLKSGDNYPSDTVIRQALKNSGIKNNVIDHTTSTLESRHGDRGDYSCSGFYLDNATIYYVKDKQGIVRVVAQVENFFKQTYDIKSCSVMREMKNCNEKILESFNVEYICKDQMLEFDFLTLNSAMNGVELIQAELPVCCRCKLTESS